VIPAGGIGRLQVLAIVVAITFGLVLDVRTGLVGQLAISAIVWTLLLVLLSRFSTRERRPFMTCLVLATVGEMAM
jgi:hypothetical protein